jgi:hypothetical protein
MWGGSTALLVTLVDWYMTRHFGSVYEIVGRFVIFMGLGTFFGLYLWRVREASGWKQPTRTGNIVRLAVFSVLMVGLIYALWTMSRH